MKHFSLGVLLGILLIGCAGFSYRYYGVDVPSYEGTLLGPKPTDDLPFSVCKPDDVKKGKCVVLLADEFYRLKQDHLDLENRLKDCESK